MLSPKRSHKISLYALSVTESVSLLHGVQSNLFDEYRIEGKDERNEIYLEVNMEQLSRALRSSLAAQLVKIKLTKKQGACLTVEIVQVSGKV